MHKGNKVVCQNYTLMDANKEKSLSFWDLFWLLQHNYQAVILSLNMLNNFLLYLKTVIKLKPIEEL